LHKHSTRGEQVKIARKYLISGRVQGVGFRFFAERWANQLGLSGYVKNCWDGTVEAYAVGDAAALEEFKSRLAEGPRSARVDSIHESEEQVNNRYKRFVVESDW
jgi:acylphosphatase